jgi:hypothetical protein
MPRTERELVAALRYVLDRHPDVDGVWMPLMTVRTWGRRQGESERN